MTDGDWLDFVVVDVFVADRRSFTGNPLAVVLGGDHLTTAQCQALAVEFQLSETVFPATPTAAGADYLARIFTITSELPFAGHPSVGVAAVLQRAGRLAAGRVTQQCGAGLVSLELPANPTDAIWLTGPVPTMGEPADPDPLLAAVGLGAEALGDLLPRTGGSGIPFAFLNVRPGGLDALQPDLSLLAQLSQRVTGVFVFALDLAGGDPLGVRARMFSAEIAGEDPATGSAALGLGGWLVASGVAPGDRQTAYVISQGVEMGRPSRLDCDVSATDGEVTRVRVGGRVATTSTGRIRIP
jgi:trans-2,3-dihydro-3-hydroxyanthranilate isomerase